MSDLFKTRINLESYFNILKFDFFSIAGQIKRELVLNLHLCQNEANLSQFAACIPEVPS